MNIDQFDWLSGLDESGWIAAGLYVTFFIITIVVIVMMLKLNADNKKIERAKSLKDLHPLASRPVTAPVPKPSVKPEPAKAINEDTNESTNAIEEAEVFLTYGLHKQAADVLEKHLKENPSDKTAREMLDRAQSEIQ